jgi:hypothetical protein
MHQDLIRLSIQIHLLPLVRGPPDTMEQEQRYLDILTSAITYHIHFNQLWLETDNGQALVFTAQARSYGLTGLVADLCAAGLSVESTQEMVDHGFAIQGQRILVDGGPVFVYEFADAIGADMAFAGVSVDKYSITITRLDGAKTVEMHGDWVETPHGAISCYVKICQANRSVPADTTPGIHTVPAEGGSSIDIEIGSKPSPILTQSGWLFSARTPRYESQSHALHKITAVVADQHLQGWAHHQECYANHRTRSVGHPARHSHGR